MASCVMCTAEFDPSRTTFEQRLVADTSFCTRCWIDIMQSPYEGDFDFSLLAVQKKGKTA